MTSQQDKPGRGGEASGAMYLCGLQVRDFRRIEEVDLLFTPEGGVTVLRGRNESGKTSVLEAIRSALGASHPKAPTRNGSDSSEIVATLGDRSGARWVVRRRYRRDEDGEYRSTLKVESADGSSPKRPQEVLSGLLGAVAIDPFAWLDLAKLGVDGQRRQAAQLVAAAGVEIPTEAIVAAFQRAGVRPPATHFGDALEAIRESSRAAREARRDANRDAKRAEERLAAIGPAAPTERVDTAALASELAELRERVRMQERTRQDIPRLVAEERRLVEALERVRIELADAQRFVAQPAPVERATEIQEAMREAEAVNAAAETWKRHEAAKAEVDSTGAAAAALDALVVEVDGIRERMFEGAKLPVPGLAIGPDGAITLGGNPFPENASGEQQVLVALAVAMQASPALRLILVDDANKLDTLHRERVRSVCERHGYQLLMVLVDDGEGGDGITIEEGRVASDRRVPA